MFSMLSLSHGAQKPEDGGIHLGVVIKGAIYGQNLDPKSKIKGPASS